MIEPAQLSNFFTIFFTSASVVVLGALYALLFALSRLKNQRHTLVLAYLCYAGLFLSALFLADAIHLLNHPFWISVIVLMLVGYFLAPRGIWHLCVGTHAPELPPSGGNAPNSNEIRSQR